MKADQKLTTCHFYCPECRYRFEAEPDHIVEANEKVHHPWRYFAACPKCGHDRARQESWEQNMMAGWAKATGPRTEEGKAKVAKNLEGYPTPEQALRTRFNAMKHGLTAQVATFFPAKPGKYPHCDTCDIAWDVCFSQVACMKRTELFLKHQVAFQTKDPGLLTELRANLHANIQAIIDDMILAIVSTGVQIKAPKYFIDKDGGLQLAEYTDNEGHRRLIEEISAHPLLKVLTEFLAKNSLSLADMQMTPKAVEDETLLRGHLDAERGNGEAVEAYARQSAESLAKLERLIAASHGRETVLIEQSSDS
jgi:hypothetical protein